MSDLHAKDVWDLDSPAGVTALIDLARSTDPSTEIVVKIVIGPSPGSDAADREMWRNADLSALSEIQWRSFPNLTHLYLWSIDGLTEVRSLPPRLECLDLRGCAKLQSLPDSLPSTLETLDLQGCTSLKTLPDQLPETLAEVYLEGCAGLQSLEPVLAIVAPRDDAASSERPTALRTLVLHGAATPGLPTGFEGESGENVAPRLRAYLSELRGGFDHLAECKVIVVGDGGHGKTSLVKAIKGDPHDPLEPYTHRISFWNWDGSYQSQAFLPFPDRAEITARINIWDFGGQDIYHNSHRMFLESRAVFLVVWRPRLPDGAPAREDFPDEPWHGLDYWLDQILVPNPQARVLVVQTYHDDGDEGFDWRSQVREEYRSLPSYVVSCPDRESSTPAGRTLRDLRGRLREEIQTLLASLNANKLPRSWVRVRERLSRWQPTSTEDGAAPVRSQMPTMPWSEFCKLARETYRELQASPPTETDLQSLVRYLHDIGVVFFPRAWRDGQRHRPVVIDQRWAIEGVYVMETEDRIRPKIEQPFGEVSRGALTAFWKQAQPNTRPEEWWVWEQCMLSSGVMIDVTGDDRQRRYLFPDFLPSRERMESDLEGVSGFVPDVHEKSTHSIVDGAGSPKKFDKAFACRLVGQFRVRVREDFRAFRYGGIVPFFDRKSPSEERAVNDRQSLSSKRPPVIVATIEWRRIGDSSFGVIQVEFLGDSAKRPPAAHQVLEWVRNASNESIVLRLEPASAVDTDVDESHARPGQDDVESAVVAGVAPRDRVIHIAISYAGNPPADEKKESGAANVDLEYLPHRVKDLIDSTPQSKCQVTAYKHGEQRDTHRSLPAFIHSLADGAIVIAVVSGKYLLSKDCMEEFLLATRRDRPWMDAYPNEAGQTPDWIKTVWVAAIDGEMRTLDPRKWGEQHLDIANQKWQALAACNEIRLGGLRKIKAEMLKEAGGRWWLTVIEYGTEVADILFNMRKNYPSWAFMQPPDMAANLAERVVKEANIMFNQKSPAERQEIVRQRMLAAWRGKMVDSAIDEFEVLLLQIPDAAERQRIEAGQSGDTEINAVANRWRASRQKAT